MKSPQNDTGMDINLPLGPESSETHRKHRNIDGFSQQRQHR